MPRGRGRWRLGRHLALAIGLHGAIFPAGGRAEAHEGAAATTPDSASPRAAGAHDDSAAVIGTASEAVRPAPARTEEAAPRDAYESLIDAGVGAFTGGHWAEARLLFERAHMLRPSARTLRALGMSAFNLHAYARASCELEAALLASEQPLDPVMRAQAERLLERAGPLVGRFAVTPIPAGGALSVDEGEVVRDLHGRVLLDIGQHTLLLHAAGHAPARLHLEVRGGENEALTVRALEVYQPARANERSRSTLRPLALASAAGGIASGAAALGAWLRSDRRFAQIEQRCRAQGGCFEGTADLSDVRRLERVSYTLLGLGASLVVTGVVLGAVELFASPPRRDTLRGERR